MEDGDGGWLLNYGLRSSGLRGSASQEVLRVQVRETPSFEVRMTKEKCEMGEVCTIGQNRGVGNPFYAWHRCSGHRLEGLVVLAFQGAIGWRNWHLKGVGGTPGTL